MPPDIPMDYIDSSLLESAGFDPDTLTLRVKFHSGGVWDYRPVTETVYQDLMRSTSKGKYFLAFIKGTCEATRVQ